MDKLYSAIIENKQKAVVGFVVAGAVAYFAKHGIDIETLTVKEALEIVAYSIIGYVSVFVKRNK